LYRYTEEMYMTMGIHDPFPAKMHLMKENAVHVVYFDPVSMLFGGGAVQVQSSCDP
jgi:hypothetical protein